MAKYYILLILLCSVIFILTNRDTTCTAGGGSSTYDCVNKLGDDDRNAGYYCCYEKAKKDGVEKSDCVFLIEEQYKEIKDYIGSIKDQGYKDVSVDCKSYYLQLGVLSLLLILL